MHILCLCFTDDCGLQQVIKTVLSLKQKCFSVDDQHLQPICVLITTLVGIPSFLAYIRF